jgi:hypothetical protein
MCDMIFSSHETDSRDDTYDEVGKESTKKDSVEPKDPDVIVRVDDPCRESETNADGLLAVWVAVFEEVAPDLFVGESLVCLGEFDEVLIGVVNGLALCELDGVWVAIQGQIRGEWVECNNDF